MVKVFGGAILTTRPRSEVDMDNGSIPECGGRNTPTSAEKLLRERLNDGGIIPLAAENVEVGMIGFIGKMAADQ